SFDGFAKPLVFKHPRPSISVNRSCAGTHESGTARVKSCVELRLAVIGDDFVGRRVIFPFSVTLDKESPRTQCICLGNDTLTGRHIRVGFNLVFQLPGAKEVLQLLVLGAWLRGPWWSLCK